jgi:hypothetical protein
MVSVVWLFCLALAKTPRQPLFRPSPVCEEFVPKSSGVSLRGGRGLEPSSPADAGAGCDRQPGRDLTLSSVRGYEPGVLRIKKEIPE